MWKRRGFEEEAVQLINSDFRDLSLAGIGFGASFFGFFAAIAAMWTMKSIWSVDKVHSTGKILLKLRGPSSYLLS